MVIIGCTPFIQDCRVVHSPLRFLKPIDMRRIRIRQNMTMFRKQSPGMNTAGSLLREEEMTKMAS